VSLRLRLRAQRQRRQDGRHFASRAYQNDVEVMNTRAIALATLTRPWLKPAVTGASDDRRQYYQFRDVTTATAQSKKSATTLDDQRLPDVDVGAAQQPGPLKPLDSTAFVAQLAQFGTVSHPVDAGLLATLSDCCAPRRRIRRDAGRPLYPRARSTATVTVTNGAAQLPSRTSAAGVNITTPADSRCVTWRCWQRRPAGISWDGCGDNGASGQRQLRLQVSPRRRQQRVAAALLSGTVSGDRPRRHRSHLNTRELGAVGRAPWPVI
jgi:hypothetical protein